MAAAIVVVAVFLVVRTAQGHGTVTGAPVSAPPVTTPLATPSTVPVTSPSATSTTPGSAETDSCEVWLRYGLSRLHRFGPHYALTLRVRNTLARPCPIADRPTVSVTPGRPGRHHPSRPFPPAPGAAAVTVPAGGALVYTAVLGASEPCRHAATFQLDFRLSGSGVEGYFDTAPLRCAPAPVRLLREVRR